MLAITDITVQHSMIIHHGGHCGVGRVGRRVGHSPPKILAGQAKIHLAPMYFGPTDNWPVSSSILRKISKIGSKRCQILRLKCTKFA